MKIRMGRKSVHVYFPYDRALADLMKTLPGYAWNATQARWEFPFDATVIDRLMDAVVPHAPEVDQHVHAWLSRARNKVAEILAARDGRGGSPLVDAKGCDRLREYQKVGVDFMATAGCALNGDEMGLGKTVQGIYAIRELARRGQITGEDMVLVVAPKSMVDTWVKEIRTWTGSEATRLNKCDAKDLTGEPGWYVINWDKVPLRLDELLKHEWRAIVADEAHRMKNRKVKRAKAMFQIGKRTQFKFAMTGTPMKNGDPAELWAQLHWLDPERFPSYWKFCDRYVETVEDFFGHKKNVGPRNNEELQEVLRTVMIARRLEDVDLQLPPMTERTHKVELTPRQRKVYNEMLEQFVAWVEEEDDAIVAKNWMVQSLRLKQIAGSLGIFSDDHDDSPKIDALFSDLATYEPGEKVVVMSQFRDMVSQVCGRLIDEGVGHAIMVGGPKGSLVYDPETKEYQVYKDRQELIDRFHSDPYCRLFVATQQTGGEGITLTGARRFAFLDWMWSPEDQAQAKKRIHRFGQDRPCMVTNYFASGTVDYSLVLPTNRRKQDIINAVMRPAE